MKRFFLVGVLVAAAISVPLLASGRVYSVVVDNVAFVHHDDAYFNCCPEMVFTNEIYADKFLIDIYEQDTLPQCLCMCYYNFTHTFEGLAPGCYTARVWESGSPGSPYELAGTTQFTILALLGTPGTATSMSECHMEPEGVVDNGTETGNSTETGVELTHGSGITTSSAQVSYSLEIAADVKLEIFNVIGSRVRVFVFGKQDAGEYSFIWDGTCSTGQRVSSGIYFVRLEAGDEVRSLPVIVLR
jgi:hypothetical protein